MSRMSSPSADVFGRIYGNNSWGFGSGHGSTLKVTRGYRAFVEDFLLENQVRSVVDYGCGEWSFSRDMDWHGASYTGLDVVGEIVERNQHEYGKAGVRFMLSPDKPEELPAGDLLIAKDVLQHLPNSHVDVFVREVMSRYRYSLITNDKGGRTNEDVPMGGWRPVDIRCKPFNVDATAVYVFHGPKVRSVRNLRQWNDFNAWTKVVLLARTDA
jgi:hypothetical protein